jgi:tyrosinase
MHTSAAAEELRVRRNIDDPQFDLEGYKIALQVLKDRDKDPTFRNDPVNWVNNSYGYFVGLHNGTATTPGCIHGSEVFLPWHRELLYRFEMALRAAKPGRTDNVTLPYWVWTEPPTGKGYPKAFEDESSPLFFKARNTALKCDLDPVKLPECRFTTDMMQKVLSDSTDWRTFAGAFCKVKPNCISGYCSECPIGKYGMLEAPSHNSMHRWIGGVMVRDTTAAEDPIFWSFHAYIDLIYQQWQCTYSMAPNCPGCNFRGMVDRQVQDVLDIERQLGYVYDSVPSCAPAQTLLAAAPGGLRLKAEGMAPAAQKASLLAEASRRMALSQSPGLKGAALPRGGVGPHTFDLKLPPPTFETAHLVISQLTLPTNFSYSGAVFLYPASAPFKAQDAEFLARHKVGNLAVWGLSSAKEHAGHGAAHGASSMVNVTHALRYLTQAQPGSAWKLTVVFSQPEVFEPGITPAEAVRQLNVPSVELVLNRAPNED